MLDLPNTPQLRSPSQSFCADAVVLLLTWQEKRAHSVIVRPLEPGFQRHRTRPSQPRPWLPQLLAQHTAHSFGQRPIPIRKHIASHHHQDQRVFQTTRLVFLRSARLHAYTLKLLVGVLHLLRPALGEISHHRRNTNSIALTRCEKHGLCSSSVDSYPITSVKAHSARCTHAHTHMHPIACTHQHDTKSDGKKLPIARCR